MREFYDNYRDHIEARLAIDSPVVLTLGGHRDADTASVTAEIVAQREIGTARSTLRFVVIEDDVPFDGGNGVAVHRFVVRAILPPAPIGALEAGELVAVERSFPLDPVWNTQRIGFVAYVENEDETSTLWAPREIIQSATFRFSQSGPTVQASRSVLLEMYTATWCPSCVYGDGAVDLLADEFGVPSALKAASEWRYLRVPTLAQLGAGLAIGVVLALVAVPRFREGGSP
jgi:thiol-disulfide isomerase/thioredoxin